MQAFLDFLEQYKTLKSSTKLALQQAVTVRFYKPGQFIRRQNEIAGQIYFIRKGLVHLYRQKEKTDWLSKENEVICPFNRFLKQESSSVAYEVLEYSEIHSIDYAAYQRLLHLEDFRDAIVQVIIERLYRVNKFFLAIACSGREKYELFNEHFPTLPNRVQVSIMASFLGVSPKTISRARTHKKVACLKNTVTRSISLPQDMPDISSVQLQRYSKEA